MASKPELADLYKAYAAQVRLILHRYGVESDLDDMVQETFIKVWKALPDFKGESALSTWIYRIAINVAKNERRAKRRKWWLLLTRDDEHPDIPSPGPSIEQQLENQTALEKAMQSLSPKLRETITLYSLKELEVEEIAAILEISTGTVKSRLHQARQQLQTILGETEDVP